MRIKLLALFGAVVVAVLALSGSAGADPAHAKNASPVTLVCDNGHTYSAVTNTGNSDAQTFSPALDIDSTSVLVPTSFGEFSGTLTDSDGNTVDQFTEPGATKGRSRGAGSTPVHCMYSLTQTFTVTESGGDLPPGTYTFSGTGSATGFVPSHK